MDLTLHQRGVIYVHKKYIKLYITGRTDMPQWNFPPKIIDNAEVLDSVELKNQLKIFIEQNKIVPCPLIFLLSPSVVYVKDLLSTKSADQAVEVREYIDTVPFEEVLSIVYTLDAMSHIAVINKELIYSLKESFEASRFLTLSIIPQQLFGKEALLKTEFDAPMGEKVLWQFEQLRQYDMNESAKSSTSIFHYDNSPKARSQKNNLPILIGVFFVLIVVLLGLLWMQLNQPIRPRPAPHPTAAPTPNISPTAELPAYRPQDARVQVLYVTDNKDLLLKLKTGLMSLGFEQIESTSTTAKLAKPIVTFSQKVPNTIQNKVTVELNKIVPDILSQQVNDSEHDIDINIGK